MRQILFVLFIVCTQATYCQVPFSCQGQYYLSLTKSGVSNSELYRVEVTDNGTKVRLDTISTNIGLKLNAMGYRITDNFIYGMDPTAIRLRKVGADGVAIDLGVPNGIPTSFVYYAGDVTPDGNFLLLIGLGVKNQIVKVDLNDPLYTCSFVPILDNNVSIVDIAFDPLTGILYGHDFRGQRIVVLDPNTGAVNTNFIVQPQVDQLGALFFDSFGNLYGYGAYGSFDQDKLVSVNKYTGEISLIAQGPPSSGQDGCACPYTMELQKIVTPEISYPCTDVVYSFIVSNGSGQKREGIVLSDTMPEGFKIKEVILNPFKGQITWSENIINVTNMEVNPGVDTIKVLVEVGDVLPGMYKNQAYLSGFPIELGGSTRSDNPLTLAVKDSTQLVIEPLSFSYLEDTFSTCFGDSVYIDARKYGITYLWSDGDISGQKWLTSPGNYTMNASSLCEEYIVDFAITPDLATIDIIFDTIRVSLGDMAHIIYKYSNVDENVTFEWDAGKNDLPDCLDCTSVFVLPLFDDYYTIYMTNAIGCVVSDRVYVEVLKDRNIYSPNIISPNGDQINDIFYLSGQDGAVTGNYLKIYDRWGNLVFDSGAFQLNDAKYGWDGRFHQRPVVEGVYTWVGEVVFLDGYTSIVKGDLTVIR